MTINPSSTLEPMVLCELTVYDASIPGTATLYIADREFRTASGDTPASTLYREVLQNPGTLIIDLIAAWNKGVAAFGIGSLTIVNTSGAFDVWKNYTFDGFGVSMYLATITAAGVLTKQLVFSGTMENPDVGKRIITVPIRTPMYQLDKSVVTTAFLGTGGAEGDSTIAGRKKPKIYGKVRNVPLILIDAVNLIYYVSQGAANLFPTTPDKVRDAGLELTLQGGCGDDYAALVGRATTAGKYWWADNGGAGPTLVKLGSIPAGEVTASVTSRNVPYDLPTLITALLTDAGVAVTGVNRDIYYPVATPNAFGAVINGEYGRYIGDDATYADVLAQLLGSVAGWMWLNAIDGYWHLQNLPMFDNQGDPLVVISDSDIIDMKKLGNPKTPGEGIPPWSITYQYDHNELVQSSGLASTTDLTWRNFVGAEYRSREKHDATVLTRYPLAQAITQTGRGMLMATPDTPSSDFINGHWTALQLGHDYYQLTVKLTPKLLQVYVANLGVSWVPAIMPSMRNARIGIRTARFPTVGANPGFVNTGNGTEVSPVNVALDLGGKKVTYIVRTTYQVG